MFAELQNIADESLLANLIRHDKLDRKIDWDMSYVFDDTACPIARLAVPQTCDTLVSAVSGSLACGGVMLEIGSLSAISARAGQQGVLSPQKAQALQLSHQRLHGLSHHWPVEPLAAL